MNIDKIEPTSPHNEPSSYGAKQPSGTPKHFDPVRSKNEDDRKKKEQSEEEDQPKMTKPLDPQPHTTSPKETPKEPASPYITPQKHTSIFDSPKKPLKEPTQPQQGSIYESSKKETSTDKKAPEESPLSPMHLPIPKKTTETPAKGQAATEKESESEYLAPAPKTPLSPVKDTKEEKSGSLKASIHEGKKEIKKDTYTQQAPTQGIYSPQFTTQQAQDVTATAAVQITPPAITYEAFVKVVVSITTDTRNTEVTLGDGTIINIVKDPQDNHLAITVQTPSDKVQNMITTNAAALVEVLAGKNPPIQATIQASVNHLLKPAHRIVEGTQNEGGPHQ